MLNDDGSFIYLPPPGYTGTVAFDYHAHDGRVGSNVATVTLYIGLSNEPLMAVAGPDQVVAFDTMVVLDGRGSYDPDAHYPLTYHWTQIGAPPFLSRER